MQTPGILTRWQSIAPELLSILRITAGFTFMLAGTAKLFAFPQGSAGGGTVVLMSQMGLAGVLETFGGAMIMMGLFTRPAAFIVSGEMAVAYFQAHFPDSIWPTLNRGVSSWLYCFVFLYLSAAGAGPWSIDALIRRKRAAQSAQ